MMNRLTNVALWTVRVTGPVLIALGLLFWSGRSLSLLPLHMLIGLAFVLALMLLTALAARAGLHWSMALLAAAFELGIPAFGSVQVLLLPGAAHWVVRVTHLLIGIAGMVLAARLARYIRSHPRGEQRALAIDAAVRG